MQTPDGKNRIRYAVVGAGNIAQVAVLPAFAHANDAELVAIVSSDRDKLTQLGARYHPRHAVPYEAFDGLCRSGAIDAAYLAVPNNRHRELAEVAARAGVHVLCEKPMATTEEDCEAMIHVAAEHRVKLMVGYRLHFEEANLEAIETARTGVLGEPRFFSSVFTQQVRPGDIRTRADAGGGVLFDMGVYCINAARYLFRDEPTEVEAFVIERADQRFSGVDETAAVLLRFPGERLAQLTVSLGASEVDEYQLVGASGALRLSPAYAYGRERRSSLTVRGKTTSRVYPRRDEFAPELEYFARCILEDSDPEPSGREGLADVRVVRAALRSAETGRAVALGPFDPGKRPDRSQEIDKPPVDEPETIHAPAPNLAA